MKVKAKKTIFICQISEDVLKVLKCVFNAKNKRDFVSSLEVGEPEKLSQIFKKLQYCDNPVIISLPRALSTCRYLKIPSQVPGEIERIVSLQAPRYLPYPADELISGYQIISTDKEGYSDINLIIVHKDSIQRYIEIFKEIKPSRLNIVLSSYGLANFYNYINPREPAEAVVIDIDFNQAELAIVSNKKLYFSRAFKFNRTEQDWERLFMQELNKSRDAYLKETSKEVPNKIFLTGSKEACQEIARILNKQAGLVVEIQESPFANLMGLGLGDIPESLSLIPLDIKERTKAVLKRKEYLRLILLILVTILLGGLAAARHLENKAIYLRQLKKELDKVAQEAKPLEELEKRFKFIESRSAKTLSSLDIVYEIQQNIPAQVSLGNLNYEEDKQVILRGQTQELNSVFAFVGQLEKSTVFKNFDIKVRYATKKKTQGGEVIDFEIICLKK